MPPPAGVNRRGRGPRATAGERLFSGAGGPAPPAFTPGGGGRLPPPPRRQDAPSAQIGVKSRLAM